MKNLKGYLVALALGSVIFSVSCNTKPAAVNGNTGKFIIVSDIHFNPIFDDAVKDKLSAAGIDKWDSILRTSDKSMLIDKKLIDSDTNYGILASTLDNMQKRLPNPSFIIIAGDFIWHDAEDDSLKAKSMRFIAQQFKTRFNNAPIIAALGNNDAYVADYDKQTPAFLAMFADAWKQPGLPVFSKDCGGCYTFAPKNNNLKFIVINSALLAANRTYKTAADSEINWIGKELQSAEKAKQSVWIISHIPPGANGYNGKVMWHDSLSQNFIDTVVKYHSIVKYSAASHTHFNEFKVFYDSLKHPVAYMRIIPSVTPYHDNNPSFEVGEFDKKTYNVTNEVSYYFHLGQAINATNMQCDCQINLQGSLLKPGNLNAAGLSSVIDSVKKDGSFKKLDKYVNFYNIGTKFDSAKTINHKNYKRYLSADSLKASKKIK